MAFAADVGEEGRCGDGQDTGEEVARPAVTAGGGGGVWTVGTDHVVDSRHVNAVVGNADNGGEYHRTDPLQIGEYFAWEPLTGTTYVNWRSSTCPGKPNETDG